MKKMNKLLMLVLVIAALSVVGVGCQTNGDHPAKEHPAKEHPAKEHPAK